MIQKSFRRCSIKFWYDIAKNDWLGSSINRGVQAKNIRLMIQNHEKLLQVHFTHQPDDLHKIWRSFNQLKLRYSPNRLSWFIHKYVVSAQIKLMTDPKSYQIFFYRFRTKPAPFSKSFEVVWQRNSIFGRKSHNSLSGWSSISPGKIKFKVEGFCNCFVHMFSTFWPSFSHIDQVVSKKIPENNSKRHVFQLEIAHLWVKFFPRRRNAMKKWLAAVWKEIYRRFWISNQIFDSIYGSRDIAHP